MEKKESATFSPLNMCEKLFNAFKHIVRPLRRLTFHHEEPGGITNPSLTRSNPSLDSGTKHPSPQKELAIAPKAEPRQPLPKPAPPPSESVPVRKVPDKAVPILQPTAPQAAKPQPLPQPTPPGDAAAATSKKNINERVEDYIKTAKAKMRTGSGVGRPPTS
ncbi:formin-like protein 3 [Cocos nucifera]|uniref:Formin-like protein 3 n=1 Tax=Cocos nucifera TaxID=13894 RepID=A0A8K0N4W2_COCNU|nr:formin-like protein 3 [Cocos nucifera]